MVYEETVKRICGEAWPSLDIDEVDGGYGIACVMAVLDGVNTTPVDIAYALLSEFLYDTAGKPLLDEKGDHRFYDPSQKEAEEMASRIEVPFRRLQASGIFSKRFNLRRDKCLNGWASPQDGRTAWCHIAGLASGFIGQGYYIKRQPAEK